MVSPTTWLVVIPFFRILRISEFRASATESPIELKIPDSLTVAVNIHESSEYEKLKSLFHFVKASYTHDSKALFITLSFQIVSLDSSQELESWAVI